MNDYASLSRLGPDRFVEAFGSDDNTIVRFMHLIGVSFEHGWVNDRIEALCEKAEALVEFEKGPLCVISRDNYGTLQGWYPMSLTAHDKLFVATQNRTYGALIAHHDWDGIEKVRPAVTGTYNFDAQLGEVTAFIDTIRPLIERPTRYVVLHNCLFKTQHHPFEDPSIEWLQIHQSIAMRKHWGQFYEIRTALKEIQDV